MQTNKTKIKRSPSAYSENKFQEMVSKNLKDFAIKNETRDLKKDNQLVTYSMFWRDFCKLMHSA
jgi:hypothetical protein